MKGFPKDLPGPKGEWLKRVNAAIAQAQTLKTRDEIEDLLGVPDGVLPPDDDPEIEASTVWIYRDPYRPNRTYEFEIGDESGVILGFVQATQSD